MEDTKGNFKRSKRGILLIIALFICGNFVYGEESASVKEETSENSEYIYVSYDEYNKLTSGEKLKFEKVKVNNVEKYKSKLNKIDFIFSLLKSNKNKIEIGENAQAYHDKNISIGDDSFAQGQNSIAIGIKTKSNGTNSIAIGTDAQTSTYENTVAIGHNAEALSLSTVAIGNKAYSKASRGVTIGDESKATETYAISIGHKAESTKRSSIAIGDHTISSGIGSQAMGNGAKALNKGTIAFGLSSKSDKDFGVSIGSFSKSNVEGGIALGENSVADKDKGQLGYGVTKEITSIDEILKMTDKKEEYEKNKKIIANKKDEYNAIITKYENASTKDEKAKIEKEKKEWLDNNKDFMPAVKENRDIISVWKSTAGALSIGQTGYTRQLTNLAAGTNDTDAVNVAQLKQMKSYVDREVSTKVGKSAYEIWKESDVKNKDKSVQDFLASLKGEKGAKGDGESAYQSWLKQKGNEGKSESDFIASLKGEKGNNGKDGKSAFEVWKDKNKKPNATEDEFFKAITKGASLSSKEKEQMNKRIDDANEKSDLALGGVSNAIAMANLPQVMGNRKFNLSASYGYYGKSHSLAIGFSGVNSKGNFIYKLSGAVNNKGNIAVGAGIGVVLGKNRYLVNDKKVENLERELKEYKDKVDRLEKLLISNKIN